MKELEVKISYACNNNCVFCLIKKQRKYGDFSFDSLLGQIKKSADSGCENLLIGGGEPLISDKFFKLVDAAIGFGIKNIQIQTNGRILAYKEFLDKIISKPAEFSFLVSFHFPNKETYMKYSQADGFDQTVEGIKNIIKSGSKIVVNTVLMKQNVNNLKEIVLLLKSLGIGKDKKSKHQIKFIDGHGLGRDFKKFVPRLSDIVPLVREAILYNKSAIVIEEIPLCLIGKDFIKNIVAPVNQERESLFLNDKIIKADDIKSYFIFSENCKKCHYQSSCKGLRKLYVEQYGLSELKPIK